MKLKLLTFHSLRGGVGRTRFALGAARNAANFGEPAYFIEMGFEDTSIVESRHPVQAPRWPDGTKITAALYEDVPPVGFYEPGEVKALMDKRAACKTLKREDEHFVPFLNDFFLHPTADWDPEHDVKLDAMLWRYNWGGTEPVHVLPASPLPRDIEHMAVLICDEWHGAFMEARFEVLLSLIIAKHADAKQVTVAIDCPRGMHGISRTILSTGIRLSSNPKLQLAEDGYMPKALQDADVEWA
jgi:hypothetical protein